MVLEGDCSISPLEQVSHRGAAPCRGHRGAGAGAVKDRATQVSVGWEGTWCFLWVGGTSFWEVRYLAAFLALR